MMTYISSDKQCSICDFWGGVRETDINRHYIMVESSSLRGKCLCNCNSGGMRNQQVQSNMRCSAFKKWCILK